MDVVASQRPGFVKSFVPLESNPEVFTELLRSLGGSDSLEFVDVLSIDEPDLLAIIPRPVHALVLVFLSTKVYEEQVKEFETRREPYSGYGEGEDVVWFKQTIYNACGFYGLLHGVVNGSAREFIEPGSLLSRILEKAVPLPPNERAHCLEESSELEAVYSTVARKGDTAAPEDPDDVVDHHFICFARSHKSGHLYELDGDKNGPIDLGSVIGAGEDMLCESALDAVRAYIHREEGINGFSLLALVQRLVD